MPVGAMRFCGAVVDGVDSVAKFSVVCVEDVDDVDHVQLREEMPSMVPERSDFSQSYMAHIHRNCNALLVQFPRSSSASTIASAAASADMAVVSMRNSAV